MGRGGYLECGRPVRIPWGRPVVSPENNGNLAILSANLSTTDTPVGNAAEINGKSYIEPDNPTSNDCDATITVDQVSFDCIVTTELCIPSVRIDRKGAGELIFVDGQFGALEKD